MCLDLVYTVICRAMLLFDCFFFFFNDTATTEIYTLSLHDALPIYLVLSRSHLEPQGAVGRSRETPCRPTIDDDRSEEHTSELQSRLHLVCRLLLEKKKNPQCAAAVTENSQPCRSHSMPPATNLPM